MKKGENIGEEERIHQLLLLYYMILVRLKHKKNTRSIDGVYQEKKDQK